MKQLYLLLAKNQKILKKLFLLLYILIVVLVSAGLWLYESQVSLRPVMREIGEKAGIISVLLMMFSMVPGMLKRFGILKTIGSLFVLFRRQFGVLAFFFALLHSNYIFSIPDLARGGNVLQNSIKFQAPGVAALTIFMLLWVTSNNFSMKFLGKGWKYLQRLVYVAAIALIFHIFAAGNSLWMVLGGFLFLELISWIRYFTKGKKEKTGR